MKYNMVFINIGWMIKYEGPSKGDPIRGGHKWLKDHPDGHEAWNFAASKGQRFGYVPGTNDIDIRNFVGATSESAAGVTVVWVARHPELGRHVIVGWFRNATIFRDSRRGPWTLHGVKVSYQIVAKASDACRVPRDRRTFPTPRGPAIKFGRSTIYYGNDSLRRAVPKFISTVGQWQGGMGAGKPSVPQGGRSHGGGRQQDPAERERVEKAAIAHAKRHYRTTLRDRSCVESVERSNKGWDLEVRQLSGEVLLVEVKGTSGSQPCAELTVREFAKMRDPEHRRQYVVYLVTQAGTPSACAHIFRCRNAGKVSQRWQSDDGRVLRTQVLEAARISAKN